jgi:hypothetical protein
MKTAEVEDLRINGDSSYAIVQHNVNTYRLTVGLFSLCFLSKYTNKFGLNVLGGGSQVIHQYRNVVEDRTLPLHLL